MWYGAAFEALGFLLLSPVALAVAGNRWQHGSKYEERDVVIIGGGSAGTYTAVRLQQMGKKVALVERNNRLGGHVNTFQVPGTNYTFDYGVQIFDDTPVVHDYFDHFGIPLDTLPGGGVDLFADFTTATPIPAAALGAGAGNLSAALFEYRSILASYPYLGEGNGYSGIPSPVPQELFITWDEFIAKHNLGALAYLIYIYNQGVGDIGKLRMLYQFKYFNTEQVRDNIYGLFQYNVLGDNQLLYNLAAAELGANVFLSSNVTSVSRGRDGVYVHVSTPSGRVAIKSCKVVIAIPPLLENLPFLDLDSEERGLFSQFFNDYYWDAVLYNTGIPENATLWNLDPTAPYGVPTNNPGTYSYQATGFPGYHSVYYSSNFYLTDDYVKAAIMNTTNRLVKAFNFTSDGPPVIVAFNNHNPFELQVSNEAIADGFYSKLTSLQGKKDTFYTGAAWECHNSGSIWNYTEGKVLPQIVASLSS